MKVVLWHQNGKTRDCRSLIGKVALNRHGQVAMQDEPAVTIQPIAPIAGACAAMLVPEGIAGVSHRGILLSTGMCLLDHADYLDFAGSRRIWISVESKVTEKQYAPETDGEDVFCFRTKARINSGERIVICPGVPGTPCGMIYRADAWHQVGLRCHNCTFDPKAPTWQPPAERDRTSLDDLYDLIAQRQDA